MKKSEFINPIKEFVEEVHNDTVGDAVKFYSNVAKKADKNAKAAKARAKAGRDEKAPQGDDETGNDPLCGHRGSGTDCRIRCAARQRRLNKSENGHHKERKEAGETPLLFKSWH